MTVPALLLSAVAVAMPAVADAPPAAIAYVGVAPDAAPEQVAMVSWDADGGATVVKSVHRKDDAAGRVATREYRGAAVQPGHYELSMMCAASGNPVFLVFETEFEAGKRYEVACQGRSARSMKVVSIETGAAAAGSVSATGK